MQRERLKKLMAKVGIDVPDTQPRNDRSQAYRELKIRWTNPAKAGTRLKPVATAEQTDAPAAAIVEDKKRSGTLPRNRSLELSPTHIFVAGVDATNKLRWWSIVPDPRVVRAETQTPAGEMRSENYYVPNVTLVVAFPDDPEIANLRFYQPVWNGTDFDLKPLTTLPTR